MKRIMIVDDASFMRLILKNILVDNGYEIVAEAANGEEAVRLYDIYKPDIVTMDVTMPIMDGLAATEAILEQHPYAKIIVCSAMGQRNLIMQMISAGAKDFIVKPFQGDRILAAIDQLFDRV